MAKYSPLVLVLALLLSACETVPSISPQAVKSAKNVAVVSAIEPTLVGLKIGITIFNNDSWIEEKPGLDVNATVLEAVRTNISREAKLVAGPTVGLVVGRSEKLDALDSLKPKLAALGREWNVDVIVLVNSAQTTDFIQRSGLPIAGVGHFYSHQDGVFCVLSAEVYDCKTGTFTTSRLVKQVRKVPGLEWHFNWNAYPADEQRAAVRILKGLLNESVAELLSSAGLNDKWIAPTEQETNAWSLVKPSVHSSVPEGNELVIPEWMSVTQARDAVRSGFKSHEWTVVTDTDERIVGSYRNGKKEATCAVTFTDKKILLTPEGYEINPDGSRVPVAVYGRWQNNLKEAIFSFLLKAPDATEPATQVSK